MTGYCMGCGCHDRQACADGCHWKGDGICSKCYKLGVEVEFSESMSRKGVKKYDPSRWNSVKRYPIEKHDSRIGIICGVRTVVEWYSGSDGDEGSVFTPCIYHRVLLVAYSMNKDPAMIPISKKYSDFYIDTGRKYCGYFPIDEDLLSDYQKKLYKRDTFIWS